MSVLALATVTLRCHHCSHAVASVTSVMRLVGIFKPSLVGKVSKSHEAELRRRCSSCGWVNVFHPDARRQEIEFK